MTYALSASLQTAVYETLAADARLSDLVGAAIYDRVPAGAIPITYVTLGDEDVRDRSDKDGGGAWHDFTVTVITEASGFKIAKEAAGAISDALLGNEMTLGRGRVVGLWFRSARARRIGSADQRRIDLRFRAQVEDQQSTNAE
ncbi:uncharacterized protein DUF3168 [Palleronia aestuarii]|uniref:Uncharacterized protein DUF3168 n=1 Tax=Palleronia aestuarii TaxID=568105 RepID=A0A2W7P2Q0_9RHOB|nr:DUF3168 domain-containing protein [Palleronia aestuarii]PZX17712.1 uncharacterized protein DUF3168 [Palleronia aestuarii]